MLNGWFTPQFPVIDTPEKTALLEPYMKYFTFVGTGHCKDWIENEVRLTCHKDYQKVIRDHYRFRKHPDVLYDRMVELMCPNLQFNEQATMAMTAFREQANVPAFDGATIGNSVAFHVRRTDKLITESRLYTGEEYVSRLVAVAPDVPFEHCCVATDDVHAVPEIATALQAHGIQCQLHAFAAEDSVDKQKYMQFFTELSYRINATYFVETFDSNVGGMVGVLRACHGDRPRETYANSFGVDADYWWIR